VAAEYQQLFVNGRPVRDPLLAQGLREACRDHFLQERAGVSYFLWMTLPPERVDVNVHPTKREVRFRDPGAVRAIVGAALREALRVDSAVRVPLFAARSGESAPRPLPLVSTAPAPTGVAPEAEIMHVKVSQDSTGSAFGSIAILGVYYAVNQGADVINMSTVPEVILARELGICYQTIAMSTDYDCWKEGEEPVTWDMILSIMKKNTDNVRRLLLNTIAKIKNTECGCMT